MKFIIADPSEERHLPHEMLEYVTIIDGVEEQFGADLIITPSQLPIFSETLRVHANKGLCVQRKTVGDLCSSFQTNDSRLWRQLIRLLKLNTLPWLIITGDIKARNQHGESGNRIHYAVVDGRETEINYWSIIGAIEIWQLHGGYYSWISRESLLYRWCEIQYGRLLKKEKQGGWKPTYVHRQPLKPIELMSDIESTLCTIPGLGPERARAVYSETCQIIDTPTLIDCLRVLKDRKIDGIGDGIRVRAMKYIGWRQ